MKLLFGKSLLYGVLILISLEIIVRIFHLHQEYPRLEINGHNVKTYVPNQEGYYATGNRRMNYVKYHINNSGFNSYHEYKPKKDKVEIALIGDSFIEGFHQNYFNSIGRKVEKKLNDGTEVYEYGHSGYDLADQLNIIDAYKEDFNLIDYTFIYLKFENDLQRNKYVPNYYYVNLQKSSLSFVLRDKIKLLSYMTNIGIMNSIYYLLKGKNIELGIGPEKTLTKEEEKVYLNNFKTLISTYGFKKHKTFFLLDKRRTSKAFLNYCDSMGYKYIDFGQVFEKSKTPTNLIYDKHWNNHGREIIASVIANYIKNKK